MGNVRYIIQVNGRLNLSCSVFPPVKSTLPHMWPCPLTHTVIHQTQDTRSKDEGPREKTTPSPCSWSLANVAKSRHKTLGAESNGVQDSEK